jgi:hypothetical protein
MHVCMYVLCVYLYYPFSPHNGITIESVVFLVLNNNVDISTVIIIATFIVLIIITIKIPYWYHVGSSYVPVLYNRPQGC